MGKNRPPTRRSSGSVLARPFLGLIGEQRLLKRVGEIRRRWPPARSSRQGPQELTAQDLAVGLVLEPNDRGDLLLVGGPVHARRLARDPVEPPAGAAELAAKP